MSKRKRRCSTPTAPSSRRPSASGRSCDLPLNGRNVWSLASTTPGRARRTQQRHRAELSRRRPAGDSEQPVARRHQLVVQPARRDQHAADCRCGDRDSGPDRQHVGRVRLVSRRRTSTWSPRAAPTRCTARCSSSSRTMRSTRADTSRTRRIRRTRGAAINSARRWTGRW